MAAATAAPAEVHSIDALLEELPADKQAKLRQLLYGKPVEDIAVPPALAEQAKEAAFELKAFKFSAAREQLRAPRVVRIGLIQHSIAAPTTAPVLEQYKAIEAKVRRMIDAAGAMKVNVLCLQEAWTVRRRAIASRLTCAAHPAQMPFAFCTREKQPWLEFAEPADETGRSTRFLQEARHRLPLELRCRVPDSDAHVQMARKYNMVIVSPILERDAAHCDTIWNTAVIIGNHGNVIGKHRKNHIPRVGDFNESTYYMEGQDGHPVFVTEFGNIGVNICYGRHHPLNWLMYGLNGAGACPPLCRCVLPPGCTRSLTSPVL